jgi:hypothetical protein
MALLTPILAPNRAITTYQKIRKVEIDADSGMMTFTIAMYIDQEARAANLPIWHDYVSIPLARFGTDIRAMGYKILQDYEGSVFEGAEGDEPAPISMNLELTAKVEEVVEVVEEVQEELPLPPPYTPESGDK